MRRLVPKLLIFLFVFGTLCTSLRAETPDVAAREILDAQTPEAKREALIASHLKDAPALLRAMTSDLVVDTPEEYRRIPFIWRVAVAASKANDPAQLRSILDLSLPKPGEPLRHWQAVVLGGGVINGLSLQNVWPGERVVEILKDDPDLRARWGRSLVLSSEMADDEKVPHGTRYDALRMIALRPWSQCKDQLTKYLGKDVNAELQQGAVSGLSDVKDGPVAELLIANLPHLAPPNRDLALRALLRNDDRRAALRAAVQSGKVKDVPEDIARILEK